MYLSKSADNVHVCSERIKIMQRPGLGIYFQILTFEILEINLKLMFMLNCKMHQLSVSFLISFLTKLIQFMIWIILKVHLSEIKYSGLRWNRLQTNILMLCWGLVKN